MLQINFIREVSAYSNALDSLINPIRKHLPESTVSPKNGVKGALNFCWFIRSQGYHPNVFMSHGIGDKNYMIGTKGHANRFDYVFVTGPAFKEKLIRHNTPAEKIFVVGWPKLDPIFNGEYQRTPSDKIRVLYAPTHNAIQAVSSFPAFNEYLDKFPPEIEVLNSPHPARREDRMPTIQPLVDADVVIADAGSTIYEAWALGKPVIFPDWLVRDGVLNRFKGAFEAKCYADNLGYHAKSFEHLLELIPEAVGKGIDERAVDFAQDLFPTHLKGNSGKTIAKILRRLANEL